MASQVTVNGETFDLADDDFFLVIGKNIRVNSRVVAHLGRIDEDLKVVVTGDVLNVDSSRSITVNGNVQGKADASGSVSVTGSVGGDVDAGGSVHCGNVAGSVDSGGSTTCGDVQGDVDAGGSVKCGNVGGDVDAGGSVRGVR